MALTTRRARRVRRAMVVGGLLLAIGGFTALIALREVRWVCMGSEAECLATTTPPLAVGLGLVGVAGLVIAVAVLLVRSAEERAAHPRRLAGFAGLVGRGTSLQPH